MAKNDWADNCPRIPKPWGHEDHFALADGLYCGKVLFIRAGHALSLQLHQYKDETISIHNGHIGLEIGPSTAALEKFDLLPGESVRIKPGIVHRMSAITDSWVLEASTTQLDDVIRLADRYGRAPTSQSL
jgi:mannose-6-phosphate isomerase-like protein (cupin superfamily)